MSKFESKKILILMSGSIACFKVCDLISRLKKEGHQVRIVASSAALKFVGRPTLEGLTGEKVSVDLWEEGRAMDHITLERWADIILAAPATAHLINRMASGIGDDLLTTLFLAHQFTKPFLIAPAMNSAMYRHPTTAKSREALKEMGLQILEPAVGPLACGEEGPGRMIEPEDILKHLENLFGPQTSKMPLNGTNKKILITAGGTREPLDDVRYLTNLSTGFTGENLAHSFAKLGFDVTLNLAASSHVPVSSLYRLERFDTYKSLEELLKYQLSNQDFDFVFHAAAVGDFSVRTAEGKLSSDHDLELVLQKNPKIINSIKHWSKNTNVRLAGFKLTSKLDEASATQKVVQIQSESKADFVIHNDLSTLKNRSEHQFTVFSPQGKTKLVGLDSLSHYFLKILGGPV